MMHFVEGTYMKRIILAGGGHGHINILKNLIKNPISDFEVILITDYPRQYYSGMLAGFIEGIYTEDDISFDVARLCKDAGVKYIEDKILSIEKQSHQIITQNSCYSYDFLSINLGSLSKVNFPTDYKDVTCVKPILNVVSAKNEIENLCKFIGRPKIFFLGAGASGVELALAFKTAFPQAEISLITAGDILNNFNKGAKNKLEKLLIKKSIHIFKNERVVEVSDNIIKTSRNSYPFDHVFITAGFCGSDVEFDGFLTFNNNYIAAEDTLFVDDNALAMGDVASIRKYPHIPKAGVFAIRQAPILYDNLLKIIKGEDDFKTYIPQKNYLQIINCGNRTAMSNLGNVSFYGKVSWIIKDKIDRAYMKVPKI